MVAIIGVNINKISVEKVKPLVGNINISNNISVKDMEELKLNLDTAKQKGLKFTFSFLSDYGPKLASIALEGEVNAVEDTKKVDDMLKTWKKNKEIDKEVMTAVLNVALTKCNIEALILSQHVNLPSPIPMPKVEAKPAESK
jgi:hypothetical protein